MLTTKITRILDHNVKIQMWQAQLCVWVFKRQVFVLYSKFKRIKWSIVQQGELIDLDLAVVLYQYDFDVVVYDFFFSFIYQCCHKIR